MYVSSEDFSRYRRVLFDPLVVYPHPENRGRGEIPASLRERIVEEYDKALREAFRGYQVVEEPGPGVLVVQSALTMVQVTSETGGELTVIERIPLDFTLSHVETQVLNGETNERLMAVVDTRRASQYQVVNGQTRWADLRRALREWARAVSNELR